MDIVKKNTNSNNASVEQVKKAVKTVVAENERTKNFIIYGAEETQGEELLDVISDVYIGLNECPKHDQIISVMRLGKLNNESTSASRPIKVTLNNSEEVKRLLSISRKLKQSSGCKNLYIAPDRNLEERQAHKKLVVEMKKLINSQPDKYHYIKDNKVMSVDKSPNH